MAILANTFVAADIVPGDTLQDDIPPTSLDIEATYSAVPNDGIQQHPFEDPLTLLDAIEIPDDSVQWCPVADSTVALPNDIHVHIDAIQQDPDQASTVVEPNGIEFYNVNPQQHTVETATCDVPNGIEVHNDELQQHTVKASEPVEKGINSYVQVIASTILQSPQQRLLVSEIYENITQNWEKFSLNERTWKTSVRHALSHNPFFIHNGRGPNGRSHYWSVHEACVKMFKRGDFRRMEAKRLVQHMEREKETKQRQEKRVNNSLATGKNISSNSSGHTWVPMQQHQYSYGNESTNTAEPSDFSSSLVSYNAQLNQHQHVQHDNYQQQQAEYQHPP